MIAHGVGGTGRREILSEGVTPWSPATVEAILGAALRAFATHRR